MFAERPNQATAASRGVRWHMIGHVQRNKSRKIIDFVRLVHSVDSLRLAEELQAVAVRREMVVEVLIQVNCSGEDGKFGCPLPAVPALAEQIETMMNLKVRGLMTMAPYSTKPDDARMVFSRCRDLYEEMRTDGFGEGRFNLLSMGMSGDYEVAIEEGSNIVRVGSAIFGEPPAGADVDDEPEPEEEAI
jgi:pyridoxal phosphate enzyme (YggS family)